MVIYDRYDDWWQIDIAKSQINLVKNLNKKESTAKLVAIYKERVNQVNQKLKEPNLSDLQRTMFETERKIASDELAKIETTK